MLGGNPAAAPPRLGQKPTSSPEELPCCCSLSRRTGRKSILAQIWAWAKSRGSFTCLRVNGWQSSAWRSHVCLGLGGHGMGEIHFGAIPSDPNVLHSEQNCTGRRFWWESDTTNVILMKKKINKNKKINVWLQILGSERKHLIAAPPDLVTFLG